MGSKSPQCSGPLGGAPRLCENLSGIKYVRSVVGFDPWYCPDHEAVGLLALFIRLVALLRWPTGGSIPFHQSTPLIT